MDDDEFWRLWMSLSIVRSYERGDINSKQFLAELARKLGIKEDPLDFRQRFLDWHPRLYSSAETLISSLANECELALLSNTNTLHWNLIHSESPVFRYFSRLFLSYEIGLCKPDSRVFQFVLENISVSASETLFLDDMQENVTAANQFGFQAVQVNGIEEVSTTLREFGFENCAAHTL